MMGIYPEKFKEHTYLQPVYGCYQFAIHAVYRLYHGWYNTGNPTDLFPSKAAEISSEILDLIGTDAVNRCLNQAQNLKTAHKFQLALHILDLILNSPNKHDKEILIEAYELKKEILGLKIKQETSFIVKNILSNGINEINNQIKKLKTA